MFEDDLEMLCQLLGCSLRYAEQSQSEVLVYLLRMTLLELAQVSGDEDLRLSGRRDRDPKSSACKIVDFYRPAVSK